MPYANDSWRPAAPYEPEASSKKSSHTPKSRGARNTTTGSGEDTGRVTITDPEAESEFSSTCERGWSGLGGSFYSLGVWRGRQNRPSNDGQIPDFRGVRLALGTGYNRGERNRRTSRNGRVSSSPNSHPPTLKRPRELIPQLSSPSSHPPALTRPRELISSPNSHPPPLIPHLSNGRVSSSHPPPTETLFVRFANFLTRLRMRSPHSPSR
jgi:hypothetical protein